MRVGVDRAGRKRNQNEETVCPPNSVALIGLEREEITELKSRCDARFIGFEMMPKVQLRDHQLYLAQTVRHVGLERIGREGHLPRHLRGRLAWPRGTRSLGRAMSTEHDCHARLPPACHWPRPRAPGIAVLCPCPVRTPTSGRPSTPKTPSVAKWGLLGNRGEGKERFAEEWQKKESTLIEPFLAGDAVRVTAIGDTLFQLRLGGDDWKKSIHHAQRRISCRSTHRSRRMVRPDARSTSTSPCARRDYILAPDGTPHLLELNHVPNVTQFPEIRAAYLDLAARWINTPHE